MNKIIISTAALLISAGAAFAAGGEHFPPYEPATSTTVDQGTTASIPGSHVHGLSNNNVTVQDSDRGIWGR